MEDILNYLHPYILVSKRLKFMFNVLKTPGVTVFQVAKNLHLSRSSIYPVMII